MADKLNLLDANIPLLERYDKYLQWDNEHSIISPNIIAQELEMGIAYVEVFLDLGQLETDEFAIIDKNKIHIDALVAIVKEDRADRLKIYENYTQIISNTQEPIKALRNFIDGDDEPLYKEKLLKISSGAYFAISKYLKQRNIENGTITKGFRKLLFDIGKLIDNEDEMSDKQSDWVIRAITHDNIHSLRVFTNDILETDFQDDQLIFKEIISMINSLPKK